MSSMLQRAMGAWLGTLATGAAGDAKAGIDAASRVVGRERFDELCSWLARRPFDVVVREQTAAIEVIVWMVHADGRIDPAERALLGELVARSVLDEETGRRLAEQLDARPSLDDLERRLTHPVLRELLLSLAWRMAIADGEIADAELAWFDQIASRLGVAPERAVAIRAAVGGP